MTDTLLEQTWAVEVPATHKGQVIGPKPKGSMKCIGARGAIKHQLVEDVDNKAWRRRVYAAGLLLPVRGVGGPLGLSVTFTLARPPSHYGTGRNADRVRPDAPVWPYQRGTGDWDKLGRIIGDAWQARGGAGVLGDDAQFVNGVVWKCYPDTPGCPDRLDQPGALIRLWCI